MTISWAEGQQILALARQNIGAKPPVQMQDAPQGGPKTGTLSDAQAAAFQIMMMIQGHDASTVGPGFVHTMEDNNGVRFDRQERGPEGSGDASAVAPLGAPDPGAGSPPEA